MSWLSSWLHPERGYKGAQEQLDKYYNEGKQEQQPYNDAGQQQYGNLQQIIDSFMHPEKLYDQWSNDYNESEATKQAKEVSQQQGLNAANSMGLGGSNSALQAIQSGTSQISADAKQKYLDDLMNKYTTGAVLANSIFGTGAGVAQNMGNQAGKMGEDSAGIQFGKTNAPGQLFGGIAGGIGNLVGNYLTGGMGKGDFGRGSWSTK